MRIERIKIASINLPPAPPPTAGFIRSVRDYGMLEPVKVAATADDRWTLLAGHRRLYAAVALKEDEVDAIIEESDDPVRQLVIKLTSNMQRSPNPADEAEAICKLKAMGYTDEQIANMIGVSRPKVTQRAELLSLVPELFAKVKNGSMSGRAGYIATHLPEGVQTKLAARDSISIEDVQELRRQQQLGTLDVDSMSIPPLEEAAPAAPITETAILAMRLKQIAASLGGGWPKKALEDAVAALESLDEGEAKRNEAA